MPFHSIWISNISKSNKTIKDGGIAPWLIWKNLSTRPYGKIWTKRKEKNTEKDLTIVMGRMVEHFLFLLQTFAPSALRLYFPLFLVCVSILDNILIIQTISWHFLTIYWHFLTSSWPEKYSKVLKSTHKYPKVSKSTQKNSKVLNSTQKYPKVPKST